MPANEQTWRDPKLMHLVFGVTSVLMLITTIWMLTADHRREWKTYQRDFRDVEVWSAKSRVSAQENDPAYNEELKKREDALLAAQQVAPPAELFAKFKLLVEHDSERHKERVPNFKSLNGEYTSLAEAEPDDRPPLRVEFLEHLRPFIRSAKFREDSALSAKKFKAADFDVARSEYELGIGNSLPEERLGPILQRVEEIKTQLADLTLAVQEATTHRKDLEKVLNEMTAEETQATKDLDDQKLVLKKLEDAVAERGGTAWTNFARELLAMPIIDAFGRPLDIKQVWLPKLTINNNFRDVPRFDRCITCHMGIDKTAPGSAIEPGYPEQKVISINLLTPTEPPTFPENATIEEKAAQMYGVRLIDHDFLRDEEASLEIVDPLSLSAKSGLQVGDVIAEVGGTPVIDREAALNFLTEVPTWGQPLALTIKRGLPGPYASHPRLDLFVGSLSPHKMLDIGCTICHDGQGSATQFKWASHSPNDPAQEEEWTRQHGWFNNHHWIFPMPPARHAESTCLKCHHEVESLLPSERFPEPPAPKLVEGYQALKDVGCFGCHEINGYDGPNRRIGPDLRVEPNYTAAAKALLGMKGLNDEERGWAEKLVHDPDDTTTRRELFNSVTAGSQVTPDSNEPPRIDTATLDMAQVLQDVEVPGKLRKVGPSLRHVASKVDDAWLYSWIRKPTDFRPDTKMPQFFGLHDHFELETKEETEYFEGIEIRGIIAYLMGKSQPFDYLGQPEGVTEEPSGERGKKLFETRGCLACHKHKDFPAATMTQGPNLSNVGAKFASDANKNGGKWLYTWLRNPNLYHPRTLMPNLILDPITGTDGKVSDPAADITVFLLGSGTEWKPSDIPPVELSKKEAKALYDLALENLKAAFTTRQAQKYLKDGIPESRANEITGDAVELIGEASVEKQLTYVGRRAIAKYGCSGCHDVPGFEDAKPIGTGLADWGRKGADKLAFEQITTYLSHAHDAHGEVPESKAIAEAAHEMKFIDMPPDEGYYMEKLFGHEREGFIWQKLREPRSYDYKKVENKGYNERLRMPKFTVLTEKQRQAIITFVLGLVAEPPVSQYVYSAKPRQAAILEGNKVLEKYNCTGCHTVKMDQWQLAFPAETFDDPAAQNDYSFLIAHATDEAIAKSLTTDTRGLRHATIHGQPVMSEETGKPIRYDEDGVPIEPDDTTTPGKYAFVLWKDAVVNGNLWPSGLQNLLVPEDVIEKQFAAEGGYLPRLIMPSVFATEKEINPNAKAEETWAYLPPPLLHEGKKVQSNWLHSFLLDPYPIRPATVLRMPKFNMSSDEATKLVNYFAAVDGADYPYNYDPRTTGSHLQMAEEKHPGRLGDALKIITDNNYCVKCHLVGDFAPVGSDRAKGPQLGRVYQRMRPEYLRDWIANPKRLLPYTAMPVNIPFDKPVSQALYKGDSVEQLDALVDLLLNYDRYMESKTSIKPLVKPAPAAEPAAKSAAATTDRSNSIAGQSPAEKGG